MIFRILVALLIVAVVLGSGWYYWTDLQLILAKYNIELGGIGSIVTISLAVLSLVLWVFQSKMKGQGSAPFIEAKRDVVIGNKKEIHNYKK